MKSTRDILFISHANPADNQFTAWLASRLSIMGFKVWADLENLHGGNKHWQVIEKTIRDAAVKVLVVTTRASREAEGVEQEINIAKGVEKENGFESFIIQLKVDDLPYTQLPPALNNRLAISFTGNWGAGLKNLASELDEENIPRPNNDHAAFQFSKNILEQHSDNLVKRHEPVFASWLPIRMPDSIHLYQLRSAAKTLCDALVTNGVPSQFFGNYVLTFALPDTVAYLADFDANRLKYSKYQTAKWIDEYEIDKCPLLRSERRHTLNGLLNSAWELYLQQLRLSPYFLSNEKAYFFTTENKEVIKQPYKDPLGRRTRPITLVGESSRYSSLWHAAISARASTNPFPHYSCRLHVAFTDDGFTPIADGDRAFKLRRSFCKQWWNDRWRRIFFATLERITNEQDELKISTGGSESIFVEGPLVLEAPYSIASDLPQEIREDGEDSLPAFEAEGAVTFLEDMDDDNE